MLITASLLTIGLYFVFSASFVRGIDYHNDMFYFMKKQMISLGIGLVLAAIVYRIGARRMGWGPLVFTAMMIAICLLMYTGLRGVHVGDTSRFIRIPGVGQVQPSEFAKLALILFLAWYCAGKNRDLRELWPGFGIALGVAGALCMFVMLGRDLGTTMVLFFTTLTILIVAGARLMHVAGVFFLAVLMLVVLVFGFGYNKDRIVTFMHHGDDYFDKDYQAMHSLLSLGSGGPTGVGLAQSREKYYYLPVPFSDFVLAIIGEETGLIGTGVVIVLFGLLVWRGLVIARSSRDRQSSILAMGFVSLIAIESIINTAVVSVLIPTTGTPLPFISYGGSSLVVKLVAIGMLLSVHDRPNG